MKSIETIVNSNMIVSGMIRIKKSSTANGNWAPRNRSFAAYDISIVAGDPNSHYEDAQLGKFVAKITGEKYTPAKRHEYYELQVNDSNCSKWAQRIREAATTGMMNGQKIVANPDGTTNMWIAVRAYMREKPGKDGGNPFLNLGRVIDAEIRIVDSWDQLASTFCDKRKVLSAEEWSALNAHFNALREAKNKTVTVDNSDDIID